RYYEGRRQHGRQLSRSEAPRNSEDVLFGSGDEIIIVADIDNRTLSFWRNDTLIGTVITSLPRGSLYPVATPFNSGVRVVVCGLHQDAKGILKKFHAQKALELAKKSAERKAELVKQKELFVKDGKLTDQVVEVLQKICSFYTSSPSSSPPSTTTTLTSVEAARLWYRCGFKLSQFSLLSPPPSVGPVTASMFAETIQGIVREEEKRESIEKEKREKDDQGFVIGDKVELSEDYLLKGDAGSGPLKQFDRGTVIEIQTGHRGDTQIRVIHNSRKWWYQPAALLSERSGLLESTSVMILREILRAHAFSVSLTPLQNSPVTPTSWRPGDWVIPSPSSNILPSMSRIVADSSRSRDTGQISLETIEGTKRLNITKNVILHSGFFHNEEQATESSPASPTPTHSTSDNSDTQNKLRKIASLHLPTLNAVTKEISSSVSILASYFNADLISSIISALHLSARVSSSTNDETTLAALCKLTLAVVHQLFQAPIEKPPSPGPATALPPPPTETSSPPPEPPDTHHPPTSSSTTTTTSSSSSRFPSNNPSMPSSSISIQDLITQDLSSATSSGQRPDVSRREILLSLMASARMEDGSLSATNIHSRLLSTLEQRPNSSNNPSLNDRSLTSRVIEGLQRNTSGLTNSWRELRHVLRSASTKRISGASQMLIQNGLLLDSVPWVKRALSAGADAKSLDEDGRSVVLVAIALGCSNDVIKIIIEAGATIGPKELEAAAKTNQPSILSLLLRHTVYDETSFDASDCSEEIKATLSTFLAQQEELKTNMLSNATSSVTTLLEAFLSVCLSLQQSEKRGKCLIIADTLVGDSLYYLLTEGKIVKSTLPTTSRRQFLRTMGLNIGLVRSSSSPSSTINVPTHPESSLLSTLPSSTLENMSELQLTTFMKTIEGFMWRKDVKDVCFGLSMSSILLDQAPSRSWLFDRYGIVELSACHINRTSSFLKSKKTPNDLSSLIKCPKNHSCELHLTKHASFRCDLCGKGVDQGKPMHGCRRCDWDACATCTDKREGGVVKWDFVRNLAKEVEEKISKLGIDSERNNDCNADHATSPNKNKIDSDLCDDVDFLQTLARKLAQRDLNTLDEVLGMLDDPGKLTVYEFSVFLLPALHAALSSVSTSAAAGGAVVKVCRSDSPRRKPMRKRPKRGNSPSKGKRVELNCCDRRTFLNSVFEKCLKYDSAKGMTSTKRSTIEKSSTSSKQEEEMTDVMGDEEEMMMADEILAAGGGEFEIGDRVALRVSFVESRGMPTGPMGLSGEGSVVDLNPGRVFVEYKGQLWHYLKTSLRLVSRRGFEDLKKTFLKRKARSMPELVRVVHTILALEEDFEVKLNKSPEFSDLQSLLVPFQVKLRRAPDSSSSRRSKAARRAAAGKSIAAGVTKFPSKSCSDLRCTIHVEPLMPLIELQAHVLRTCRVKIPSYINFCRKLALDRAIVAERPFAADSPASDETLANFPFVSESDGGVSWNSRKVARVVAYDDSTCTHIVRYASHTRNNSGNFDDGYCAVGDLLDFNGGEARLVLAGRDYLILSRDSEDASDDDMDSIGGDAMQDDGASSSSDSEQRGGQKGTKSPPRKNSISNSSFLLPVGTRVESNIAAEEGGKGDWEVYTIVAGVINEESATATSSESKDDPGTVKVCKYNLVSEDGSFYQNVLEKNMRGRDLSLRQEMRMHEHGVGGSLGDGNDSVPRSVPVSRRQASNGSVKPTGVIRRVWSALTDAQNVGPMQLGNDSDDSVENSNENMELTLEPESPPQLGVEFSVDEKIPPMLVDSYNMTLFHALQTLQRANKHDASVGGGTTKGHLNRVCSLFYNIVVYERRSKSRRRDSIGTTTETTVTTFKAGASQEDKLNRRKAEKRNGGRIKVDFDDDCTDGNPGDETRPTNVIQKTSKRSLSQCDGVNLPCQMCLEVLSLLADVTSSRSLDEEGSLNPSAMFVCRDLTKKLLTQLEDPLAVVSGALPDWCICVPSLTPRLFSHESRRILLERGTFGVSRAVFRQQENKVDVQGLRSRMEAIRQRAVALMQEAFSVDAEDPMALQLQADELYTLEESLKSQVASAFKRQRWAEHWLKSAKGVVSRKNLLADAQQVLSSYAMNSSARRRRLEIQFTGESGFDAASGEQAGVTRGFYADVAGEMMRGERAKGSVEEDEKEKDSNVDSPSEPDAEMWIRDIDPSGTVIIPTPRASTTSVPGLFPLPVAPGSTEKEIVCNKFRMLGRLFASALRDGFLVPLPLSFEFITLIQRCDDPEEAPDEGSEGNNMSTSFSSFDMEDVDAVIFEGDDDDLILGVEDLPRPGFVGGEIYGIHAHICSQLKTINDSSTSERKKMEKREEVASNKDFARKALNAKYDCSFNDYVAGRVFVDPFDVSQSDGFELCVGGRQMEVTIDNVQEYIALCKRWILHEGIISQAQSFRAGVNDFFPSACLSLLTPEELRMDICGEDDVKDWTDSKIRGLFKLDGGRGAVEAMVAVAAIGGEGGVSLSRKFSSESPTFNFLVKTLLEASVIQRRQFLTFVTSLPIITPGLIEVQPIVSPTGEFMAVSDSNLPRANTCARRLYLPRFESIDEFKKIWNAIIDNESQFKGFFEWQG
ncbi:hypothetical protein TrRE_jg3934, partial [Triparma retinervis]